MKVIALLIFWSFPLLPIGGPDQSPPVSAGAIADADFHVTPAVIQPPVEADFAGDLGKVSLGSPFWDEEDSLDDHLMDGKLLPGPLWWASVRDHRFWFAYSPCHLVRPPCHLLPLRC